MMVWLLFIIDLMGLFFYTKIGSIISIGDLPTTNIIEPFYIVYFLLYNFAITSNSLVKFLRYLARFLFRYHIELKVYHFQRCLLQVPCSLFDLV